MRCGSPFVYLTVLGQTKGHGPFARIRHARIVVTVLVVMVLLEQLRTCRRGSSHGGRSRCILGRWLIRSRRSVVGCRTTRTGQAIQEGCGKGQLDDTDSAQSFGIDGFIFTLATLGTTPNKNFIAMFAAATSGGVVVHGEKSLEEWRDGGSIVFRMGSREAIQPRQESKTFVCSRIG